MRADPFTETEVERIRKAFADVPFARLLGIKLGECDRGSATLHLDVRNDLKQNLGVVHGGVIASLLDTAAAFAIITLLSAQEQATTVSLTVNYLRPLTEGKATAVGRVLRAGRRLLTVSAEVLDDRGNIAATALTTYIKLS